MTDSSSGTLFTLSKEPRRLGRVLLKALAIFLVFNLLFAFFYPLPALGRISAYNRLFPGRERLPYGDQPSRAYNLSLYNLEAMFASHEIAAGPKPPGEYRVILIGDSATWGFLLPADQTLAAYLNQAGIQLPDGRKLRAYNLGYPVMSLAKDLLILSYAMRYQPDLIVWPFTLESMPYDKQLYPPLLQNNPQATGDLIRRYQLNLNPADPAFKQVSIWDRTIPGARRPLADLLRLQMYGVLWAATGVDQDIPAAFTPRQEDLKADLSFHNLQPIHLQATDLALDIIEAGYSIAAGVPLLLVNEPMFISQGQNSNLRYNFYYPRWAYDDYRQIMQEVSRAHGWQYLDAWNSIPSIEFTNSAVHMTPGGTRLFAQQLAQAILQISEK
jgi:hypothetical protein